MEENKIKSETDSRKWSQVLVTSQFAIACLVFLTEVVDNIILYLTRSQGYGPDTIVEKLIRYLFISSAINFAIVFVSWVVEKVCRDQEVKKYLLMTLTIMMCTSAAYSHYQLVTSFAIFAIPIIISILFEDQKLTLFSLVLSAVGITIAGTARATDPLYNSYAIPETAIIYLFCFTIFIFARMISVTLVQRREDMEKATIESQKAKSEAEKMMLSMKMLETLAGTIDAKDKYTNGHSVRVAQYAVKLAESLGMDPIETEKLKFEALLHDIGKIGIPDAVLNKPSKLTDTEFSIIKSHTVIGSDILKNLAALPDARNVARHHHERYDGKGYPDGIKMEEIPYEARIICIADSYDAMSSDRIYRKALPREVVRDELVKGRGTQFDPEMLDVFLKLFDEDMLGSQEIASDDRENRPHTLIEDLKTVLERMTTADIQQDSIRDFDNVYNYIMNIGARYNRSIELISVEVEAAEAENDSEDRRKAALYELEVSIRKNIRSVDLYRRSGPDGFMVVLLDAGVDNLGVIQQRIQFDYDQAKVGEEYRLNFRLNKSIENSGNRG